MLPNLDFSIALQQQLQQPYWLPVHLHNHPEGEKINLEIKLKLKNIII